VCSGRAPYLLTTASSTRIGHGGPLKKFVWPTALAGIALQIVVVSSAHAGNVVSVISNPKLKVQLTKDEVKDIFLASQTMLLGHHLLLLDQEGLSAVRTEFYRQITGKDPTEMKIYWAEQIFSGRARAPQVLASDQNVIEAVLSNPDAIGYVSGSADTSKVNVVFKLQQQ
jgi:ABC-type phosphate transport system substrate-binding protein